MNFSHFRKFANYFSSFFGLNPRGAIESSNLFRLVKFGTHKPELVSVKFVSLAHQVEDQLRHPLYKGDVRTSNWSKALSKDQINYAAADAYAGFMLYHCMNAKRLSMKPVPPLPIYAEKYPPQRSRDDPILLGKTDGTVITSEDFFGVKPIKTLSAGSKSSLHTESGATKVTAPKSRFDQLTQTLHDDLVAHRAALAKNSNTSATRIIPNKTLEILARNRPSDIESLLSTKGIGKHHIQKHGSAWLEVISLFNSRKSLVPPATNTADNSKSSLVESERQQVRKLPRTPRQVKGEEQIISNSSPDSPPAFGSPLQRPHQLPTGLSFNLAETTLDAEDTKSENDSDDSLPSLDFGCPSPRLKRKRAGSHNKSENLHQPANSCDSKRNGMPPSDIGGVGIDSPYRLPTAKSDAEPLTPRSRISRNKLLAFSKLVARKLPVRPTNAPPVVTDHTLDLIIRTAPRTQEELEKIVGIDSFLLACEQADRDLLSNIIKFAPARL